MKVLDSRLRGLWDDAQQLALGIDLIGAVALSEVPGEALAHLPDEEQARGLHEHVLALEGKLEKSFPGLATCPRHVRIWADGDGFPEYGKGYVWRIRIWVEKPPELVVGLEEPNTRALDVWERGVARTLTAHDHRPEQIRLLSETSATCDGCGETRALVESVEALA